MSKSETDPELEYYCRACHSILTIEQRLSKYLAYVPETGSQVLDINDVSDAVSLNEERVYDGTQNTYGVYGRGSSVRMGSYRGKGRVIGDVIVNSPTHPDIIFNDVSDPDGIVRLIKSLKKQRQGK